MMIRIAFREEGQFWNAYLARQGSMEGAFLIGSIGMGAVMKRPDIKEAFIDVMKQVLAAAVEDIEGVTIKEWNTRTGPETKRSGHS